MPTRKDWATLADRLEWLVSHFKHLYGLSERAFSEKAGGSRSAIGQAIARLKTGGDVGWKLLRGVQSYTGVTWAWLMVGEGEPFVEGHPPTHRLTPVPQSGERDSDRIRLTSRPTKK